MKILVLILESAMPAVDQPASGMDGRKVNKMFMCHFPTMAWSPSAMLPSFISLNKNNKLYKKRGFTHDEIQYIQ
jgi:hypothetical protein